VFPHIDPKRLFEMAKLHHIFDQPEWPHLRNCELCCERYIDFVRHLHQDSKGEEPEPGLPSSQAG